VERLFRRVRRHCLAAGLAGAGGGGFAYFFCADREQAMKLRGILARVNDGGRVYGTRINQEGLRVSQRNSN